MRIRLLLLLPFLLAPAACHRSEEPLISSGPMVGHVTADTARIWARSSRARTLELTLAAEGGDPLPPLEAAAEPARDFCVVFEARGLRPGTRYRYTIGRGLPGARDGSFTTAPPDDARGAVTLALGSCAHHDRFPSQPVWTAIGNSGAEALVLLGDTPYIDSTALARQRQRYREFYAVPELAPLLARLPTTAVWDDHDFGANDADGRLEGKEEARRAFVEHHANPSYGDGRAGIYTSFRRGPIEVFLLDTRWFANRGPSPVAPARPTLLGEAQWRWLLDGLQASTAPFKLLACGTVWNRHVRPGKVDHWMAFPHEREALFRFLGEKRIGGVVLAAGDLHRSRALRHPAGETGAGYDLWELITSPLANTVHEDAGVPAPEVAFDLGDSELFLLLTADASASPATLTARFMDGTGRERFAVKTDAVQLASR
jgi:alkaline phosphatase D